MTGLTLAERIVAIDRAIVAAGTTVDVGEVLRWVGRIAGDADPRYDRIARVLTRR